MQKQQLVECTRTSLFSYMPHTHWAGTRTKRHRRNKSSYATPQEKQQQRVHHADRTMEEKTQKAGAPLTIAGAVAQQHCFP